MVKGRGKMVVVPIVIAVVVVASALIFVYMGGLASPEPTEYHYKVTVHDTYDNLAGNTLELRVFSYLAEGYETVDVTSGTGYILGDYGSIIKVIGVVNGVVDDAYYSVNIDELTRISACGLLFDIIIVLKTATPPT